MVESFQIKIWEKKKAYQLSHQLFMRRYHHHRHRPNNMNKQVKCCNVAYSTIKITTFIILLSLTECIYYQHYVPLNLMAAKLHEVACMCSLQHELCCVHTCMASVHMCFAYVIQHGESTQPTHTKSRASLCTISSLISPLSICQTLYH